MHDFTRLPSFDVSVKRKKRNLRFWMERNFVGKNSLRRRSIECVEMNIMINGRRESKLFWKSKNRRGQCVYNAQSVYTRDIYPLVQSTVFTRSSNNISV